MALERADQFEAYELSDSIGLFDAVVDADLAGFQGGHIGLRMRQDTGGCAAVLQPE